MNDADAVRSRIELLLAFRSAVADWHAKTEELEEENLLFAAAQPPQAPGPDIEAARRLVNRNIVAARQALTDAKVYRTVSVTLADGSAHTIDPLDNIFGEALGTSLVREILDMADRAIGVYEQASSSAAVSLGKCTLGPDLSTLQLSTEERFALDRVVEYQFEHAEATPVAHVLLARAVDQAHSVRTAIASLEAKQCVEVQGYPPTEFVHLLPRGLLHSISCSDVTRFSEALLAYLQNRLGADGVRFRHYTWRDLQAAQVIAHDEELPRVATIIKVLDFDLGRVEMTPERATWEIPADLVEMRAITDIEGLRARADRRRAERRAPAGATRSPRPLEELAKLSKRLEAAAHESDAGALKRLGDAILAERQKDVDEAQRELSKLKAEIDAKDRRIAALQSSVSPGPAQSPARDLEDARQEREHQHALELQVLEHRHETELELLRAQSAVQLANIKADGDRAVARETARDEVQGKNQRSTAKIGLLGPAIGSVIGTLGIVAGAMLRAQPLQLPASQASPPFAAQTSPPTPAPPYSLTSATAPVEAAGVLSVNQHGGQTAHTINNNAPLPRRLASRDAATVRRLTARPVRGLSVNATSSDSETKELASDFWGLGTQLNWEVLSRPNLITSPDLAEHGILVESTAAVTDRNDPLRALVDWLRTQGINAVYRAGSPSNAINVGPQ